MKSLSHALAFFAVALCLVLSGCGQNKFPVKPAKGKLLYGGKPVTSGSVTFTPLGNGEVETGKPASAAVGPDGTFVLSTFDRFDGAIVGKHRVQYNGSEDEESEEAEEIDEAVTSPEEMRAAYKERLAKKQQQEEQYVQNGEIVVEVQASGSNDFTIDLKSGSK